MEIGQIVYANSRIQFGEQNSPVGASCKFFKLVIGGLRVTRKTQILDTLGLYKIPKFNENITGNSSWQKKRSINAPF